MVDARDSKSRSFGSEGSSPSAGISFGFRHVPQLSDVFCLRPEMSVIPLTLTCLLLLLVAIFSAVVSALETALLSLKEHHIAVIGDDSPEITGMMRAIARQPRRSLHQVILLGSVLNLSMAVLGLLVLQEFGPVIPGRPLLSGIVLFGALVLIGEVIPTLAAMAAPTQVFRTLITPFIWISPWLEKISERLESLTDRLGASLLPFALKPRTTLTDDEVETLVEMRREQGVLAPAESEIIHDIIRLGNKTVKDCMTPRVATLMLNDALDNEAALAEMHEEEKWHWFVPVFQGSPDLVIGVLDVKRWLYDSSRDFREFVTPPVFVSETMKALDAFREHLGEPKNLCVVVDEYGGVEGVITHSDIIEEILADAAPTLDQEEEFLILSPGRIRADGEARLDDIGEELGMDLDHEGLDTIGGLVFNELGHLPPPGTEVIIDGLRITVLLCENQRVASVEIEKLSEGSEPLSHDLTTPNEHS